MHINQLGISFQSHFLSYFLIFIRMDLFAEGILQGLVQDMQPKYFLLKSVVMDIGKKKL